MTKDTLAHCSRQHLNLLSVSVCYSTTMCRHSILVPVGDYKTMNDEDKPTQSAHLTWKQVAKIYQCFPGCLHILHILLIMSNIRTTPFRCRNYVEGISEQCWSGVYVVLDKCLKWLQLLCSGVKACVYVSTILRCCSSTFNPQEQKIVLLLCIFTQKKLDTGYMLSCTTSSKVDGMYFPWSLLRFQPHKLMLPCLQWSNFVLP